MTLPERDMSDSALSSTFQRHGGQRAYTLLYTFREEAILQQI